MHFITEDKKALAALQEAVKELPSLSKMEGTYTLIPCSEGLKITNREIHYADLRCLLRAIGLVATGVTDAAEKPNYQILGAMPDASRNAVPKVETLKKLFRMLALEGYNAVMLYTEDTYEVPEEPYFGHLRGRYTGQELRELDDYADLLGMELIPAVQTLAHLNGFFEWPASYPLNDCNDILLVGDDQVYELIDTLLNNLSQNVRSRKINIGLDEAFMLGGGAYLEKYGYTERPKIMRKHMERVVELCKKYGYTPRMWSDMFFRMHNNGVYRVLGSNVPKETAESVPEELTLVYWDYSQISNEVYDDMFRQHRVFKNNIAFAGGVSSWYGLVPLNQFGETCSLKATASIEKANCKEVYVTMWGDDGGSCSLFTTMYTLFIYGEACWGHRSEGTVHVKERLQALLGIDADTLLALEDLHNLPTRVGRGNNNCNPSKYMLYANILTGKWDCHIPAGSSAHLMEQGKRLHNLASTCGDFSYTIESIACLADALAAKAELGHRIYAAYHAEDRDQIRQIATQDIPLAIEKIQVFKTALRKQWMKENKPFGFDVLSMRLGGLISQMEDASHTLLAWLDGELDFIDELEQPRLPYRPIPEDGDCLLSINRWIRIAGQNIANMFGYK